MSYPPEIGVALTELNTKRKIELAALATAETVRQATGQIEFTPDEIIAILEDRRPSGFNVTVTKTTVDKS